MAYIAVLLFFVMVVMLTTMIVKALAFEWREWRYRRHSRRFWKERGWKR